MKIAIVGTGKMGSLLAERLAGPGREILLIGREPLKTYQAAREAGCRAGTLEMAAGAAVVILALPAAAVLPVAKQLEPYLGPGTLLVNIATSAPTEPIRQAVAGRGGEGGRGQVHWPCPGDQEGRNSHPGRCHRR